MAGAPLRVDHIGVAVRSIEEKAKLYRDILGLEYGGEETVAEQGVKVAFFKVGESNIELIEPLSEDGPVGKFIEKRGEGIHHIALAVEGIEGVIESCVKAGVKMIDAKPRTGAHGKKIAFMHPASTGGPLIELCEG